MSVWGNKLPNRNLGDCSPSELIITCITLVHPIILTDFHDKDVRGIFETQFIFLIKWRMPASRVIGRGSKKRRRVWNAFYGLPPRCRRRHIVVDVANTHIRRWRPFISWKFSTNDNHRLRRQTERIVGETKAKHISSEFSQLIKTRIYVFVVGVLSRK